MAWSRPRVDYCYDCLPGGPFPPPPCRQCGSTTHYFTGGLCRRCHHRAPQPVESCLDCHAWGVLRKHKWLCWGCKNWHERRLPEGVCRTCSATRPINVDGICRLCWRQFVMCGGAKGGITVEEANHGGQQLFFANLHVTGHRGGSTRQQKLPGADPRPVAQLFRPVQHRQLVMLDLDRDLVAGRAAGFREPTHAGLTRHLEQTLSEHATTHGWGHTTIKSARQGLMILLSLQDTPGAPLKATDILRLIQIELPARRLLDICSAAGVLDDDRVPAVLGWFATQITGLPEPMSSELHAWFGVMLHGSKTPPRRRARSEITTRLHLRWVLPALRAWAAAGKTSLREISIDDIYEVLPASGSVRVTMGQGLRSLFRILHGLKIVFNNPARYVRSGTLEPGTPLPVQIAVIREALDSTDPARAALAALVAFHALRAGQLRHLQLTDIRDGRLHLDGRVIPLAEPVRARLAAWLDYRNERWPETANPHVFLNARNAIRTNAPGTQWLYLTLGVSSQAIREDRILHEVHATGGDVRRVADLFGLSIDGVQRYLPPADPGPM